MLKLCGIRRKEDIEYINEFLPDFMGMILSPGFGRSLEISCAEDILHALDPRIKRVGVFVDGNVETVSETAARLSLDAVQLHGSESPDYINALRKILPEKTVIWKAVRVREKADIERADAYGCDMLLLDSFVKGTVGGTGKTADWGIIKNTHIKTPFFLAGGINADNLRSALEVSDNIDISGGTETDGVKDREKIKLIANIYKEVHESGK